MKQIGKQGKINQKANREIDKIANAEDILLACEPLHNLGLLDWQCLQATTNAHRHGRNWYKGKPIKLLWDKTQWIKACIPSHKFIDHNTDVREKVFMILRGKEKIG
jgi:hypothetical protein